MKVNQIRDVSLIFNVPLVLVIQVIYNFLSNLRISQREVILPHAVVAHQHVYDQAAFDVREASDHELGQLLELGARRGSLRVLSAS